MRQFKIGDKILWKGTEYSREVGINPFHHLEKHFVYTVSAQVRSDCVRLKESSGGYYMCADFTYASIIRVINNKINDRIHI